MAQLEALLKLVGTPRDTALLRYSLGNEFLKIGNTEHAILHLRASLEREPTYSAAWKVLGNALARADRIEEALDAYRRGIAVAEARGDVQAAKEMKIFARRIERQMRPDG
jgi:predicted Zn-dependent protease